MYVPDQLILLDHNMRLKLICCDLTDQLDIPANEYIPFGKSKGNKMNTKTIKTLICESTTIEGTKTAAVLKEHGIYAAVCENHEASLIRAILSDSPDVVVVDLEIEDTDAIAVIKKVRSMITSCPVFIVLSEINNGFIERQVLESGASYFLPKPYNPDELSEIVKSFVNSTGYNGNDPEIMVTELIRQAGIPAHIKGYRYIRYAILECIENGGRLDCITKQLYPSVAKKYATTPARVERAIRGAIDKAWDRYGAKGINAAFGYNFSNYEYKPTNSEFIACAVDKTLLQMKINAF